MRRFFRWLLPLFFLLATTGAAWPAPSVKLPDEIHLKPGRLGKIAAECATPVKWVNTSADLDLIPSETGHYAIVSGPTPGTYRVAAYTQYRTEQHIM